MYAGVAIKVDQWFIISTLGFKTETPQLFFENPGLYHRVRIVLFAGTVIALLFSNYIPLYVGFVFLVAIWLGAFWIGRKTAFNTYRRIYREMMEYEDELKVSDPAEYERLIADESSSERRADLEKGMRATDRELIEMMDRSIKWGI